MIWPVCAQVARKLVIVEAELERTEERAELNEGYEAFPQPLACPLKHIHIHIDMHVPDSHNLTDFVSMPTHGTHSKDAD